MKKQLEEVNHEYIRYANCWEDADVLLHGLNIESQDRVLSIGSAGDNSFSILSMNPQLVVAVDINEVQLNLIELKRAAYKKLDYEEFICFLGFKMCTDRLNLYSKLRDELGEELQLFWDDRETEIENGIIYAGKFENYFKLFRTRILPMVHRKKTVDKLFEPKTADEQKVFFERKWNTWRWRLLFKLFFSKAVMGRFGRDPKFLKEVKLNVSEFILDQARNHLSSVDCQYNYFLKFMMLGHFGSDLPHYAREENFERIKSNLHKLVTFHGLAENAFLKYPEFDKFNLSNIFEYMSDDVFKMVGNDLIAHGSGYSRYVYWNLMVERNLCDVNQQLKEAGEKLDRGDNGFFYLKVNCDIKS